MIKDDKPDGILTESDNSPAPCWVSGPPQEPGLWLTRWATAKGTLGWPFLFEVVQDSQNRLTLYLDHHGGDTTHALQGHMRGVLTHHCAATGENFAQIMAHYVRGRG